MPRLITFSLKTLLQMDIITLPTDKDGGFAITNGDGYREAVRQIFADTMKYTPFKVYDKSNIDLFEDYRDAALAISIHDKPLRRALLSDGNQLQGMISKLQLTVKSHKTYGEVKCRALHAYQGCPMNPGMKWLMQQLNALGQACRTDSTRLKSMDVATVAGALPQMTGTAFVSKTQR